MSIVTGYKLEEKTKKIPKQWGLESFLSGMSVKNVKDEDYEKSYMAYLETSYATFDKKPDELKSKYTKDKVLDERVYKEELENFLINKQVVDTALLENLAKQRVQNLKAYLTEHKIPDEQIVVTQEV